MNINRPRCPFESLGDDEEKQIQQLNDITVQLLDKRYPEGMNVLRGVHPKAHGCVEARFTVNSQLDDDLQVGLFANPGQSYQAVIRFSNAAARVMPDIIDGKHGSRGMAVKVFDVNGDMLVKDNGLNNQDLLMINQPAFAFANTEDYLRLNQILLEDEDRPERFFMQMPEILNKLKNSPQDLSDTEKRILRSAQIVEGIQKTPDDEDANPLQMQYFSAAPFLFGENKVMKFSAKPILTSAKTKFPENPADDYLRKALNNSMQQNENITFQFLLQVREYADDLDIENASSVWDEAEHEFIEVARINIAAPQKAILSDGQRAHCEALHYNPWHSLKAHRPLGSINRLRKSVYLASASHRTKR